MYTRVDAPTEKKKLPVHYAETRLSEASTRATAGAIFQTEIVKRSRRITVFCFEIHIGTRIRIVSACQIPFLRKNIEGLYNRNRVRSRRITVFCFKIQIRISRVTTFCSVARQRTCVYEYSCTRTTPPPIPHPPIPPAPRSSSRWHASAHHGAIPSTGEHCAQPRGGPRGGTATIPSARVQVSPPGRVARV